MSVIRIKCQRFREFFRFRNVVTKLNCSGNPWLKVRLKYKQKIIMKYCLGNGGYFSNYLKKNIL